jgi:hypothetical protein
LVEWGRVIFIVGHIWIFGHCRRGSVFQALLRAVINGVSVWLCLSGMWNVGVLPLRRVHCQKLRGFGLPTVDCRELWKILDITARWMDGGDADH